DKDELIRGRVLEPYVANAFGESRPWLELHPGGLYASQDRPWQMATFDRIALDMSELDLRPLSLQSERVVSRAGQPVEIKTSIPGDHFGEEMTDRLPVHIRAQGMWQLDVYDADIVWVPVQFMMPWHLRVYCIERTDAVESDLALMREEAVMFLDRCERD